MKRDVYLPGDVARVIELYGDLLDDGGWRRSVREQLASLADRLLDAHRAGHPGAVIELRNWFPGAAGRSARELLGVPLSRDGARTTAARGHGFDSWEEVEGPDGSRRADPAFEAAVELVLAGDSRRLARVLDDEPDLVTRRSHWGHEAPLLVYLAANGVETYRQRVPRAAATVALLLLERGADPAARARVYRGRHTALELLTTSAHPAAAGVADELLGVLARA